MLRLLPFTSLAFSLLAIPGIVNAFSIFLFKPLFIPGMWIPFHPFWSALIALLLAMVAFVAEKRPPFSTVAVVVSGVLSSLLLFLFLASNPIAGPFNG